MNKLSVSESGIHYGDFDDIFMDGLILDEIAGVSCRPRYDELISLLGKISSFFKDNGIDNDVSRGVDDILKRHNDFHDV